MKKLIGRMFLVTVLAIPVILMTSQSGFCNGFEPPQSDERSVGPAVVGSLTVIPTEDDEIVYITFSGQCKGKDVVLPAVSIPTAYELSSWTEDILEGRTIEDVGPAGCYSDYGGEMMVINTVMKFNNYGDMVTADMVLLFVVPKSNK